ncbi:hemerythrin domain-containing protein [Hydrogenophilus thermoluteolus]|uniref:hemerythrin domain-containing protein n=1 Tax=Hydrogenophilus thermoluteolus TaxID=297 RepID=UPI003F66CAE3
MNAKNVNADAAQRFHGAWRLIEDEHQALAAVLHALRFLLDEIGAGRIEPDFRLLRAMLYYLTEYPERRHHPNEDRYLFARLKEKTSEADAVIARLEKEHAAAEQRIAELEAALHAFASHEPGGFDRFRDVFDRYAHFYRQHMMTEEREVLPIAERHFTPEDWAWVAEGWRQGGSDPMVGTTTRYEWQAIFDKLVRHAPPPIGLGAGPYPEEEPEARS